MANKKDKNAISENIDITNNQNSPASDGEIFAEIKQVMEDGSYKEKPVQKVEKEEIKKTKDKPKKSKKSKLKHEIKVLAILGVLGVFTGSGLGVWYFNNNLKTNVNYDLNPADYRGSVESVFNELSISDLENWEQELIGDGKTPADLTPLQNILLAEHNAKTSSSYNLLGTGKVLAMGTTQTIYSRKTFNGSQYAAESISAGMLTVASCDVMNYKGSKVVIYQGKNPKKDGATWVKDSEVSTSDFEELSGVLPNEIFPYLFSENTIESASEVTKDETSGNYTFTLTMKPLESALLYYKQVRRSGGLESDPEFKNIQLTFTINSNWQLVSSEVNETYKAIKFGMGVTCKGYISTTYTFDGDVTMPV